MIVEILGTRVIGPVFGVSLFVWSALLAITLVSLATGYYAGGLLADKAPSARVLGMAAVVAGVALAIVPVVRYWVLGVTQGLGPRVGSLTSALLLFAPSLTALGSISPIAVRIASNDVEHTGRRVGVFFAVSTLGSVAGTFLVAFWLVPSFETDHIILSTSGLLIVAGVALLFTYRPVAILALIVPILSGHAPKPSYPNGFHVIDRAQSMLGLVEVIDDRDRNVRFLRVDHSLIGAELVPEYESAFSFVYMLEFASIMRPNARTLLQLGLGTGSVARSFERRGIKVDTVEIDPVVVRFAKRYFEFATTGSIFVEDARAYLHRTERSYDILVHDTFTGGATPEHLLSKEILIQAKRVLRPGGLLVLNFVGGVSGSDGAASKLVARTLRNVFREVRVFKDSDKPGIANIVYFAADRDLGLDAIANARFHDDRRENARQAFLQREVLVEARDDASGPVITDEHNPLARLELPIAEQHYAAMNKLLPASLWLH